MELEKKDLKVVVLFDAEFELDPDGVANILEDNENLEFFIATDLNNEIFVYCKEQPVFNGKRWYDDHHTYEFIGHLLNTKDYDYSILHVVTREELIELIK